MRYPKLPPEYEEEVNKASIKYTFNMKLGKYPYALKIAQKLYKKMLVWQNRGGGRFHKGYPLHNIGYTLFHQGKPDDALEFFLLAYIEDLISADNEDEADFTPAGKTLILGYKYDRKILESLKKLVAFSKEHGETIFGPERILDKLKKTPDVTKVKYEDKYDVQGVIEVKPKKLKIRTLRDFGSDWDERVFIGGSGELSIIIDLIKKIIEKLGYDPIVANEFQEYKDLTIYHKCLLLLHSSKYAVFDLSDTRGQMDELERTTDYGVKTLIILSKGKEKYLSQMVTSKLEYRNLSYETYKDEQQMEEIISNFLSK